MVEAQPAASPAPRSKAVARATRSVMKAKVCLVGEAAVGKTSLIRRFVLDQFDDRYLSTIAAKVTKKELVVPLPGEGVSVTLELTVWDVMGQTKLRELLADAYFTGVTGIIAVADMTRRQTLDALYEWIDRVDKVTSQAPVVLAGNKSDLVKAAQLSEADVAKVAAAFHGRHVMTSAKTGQGVEEIFRILAGQIVERMVASR